LRLILILVSCLLNYFVNIRINIEKSKKTIFKYEYIDYGFLAFDNNVKNGLLIIVLSPRKFLKKLNIFMTFNRTKEFEKDNEWGKFGEEIIAMFIQKTFKSKNKTISYWFSNDAKNKLSLKLWDLRFGVYENGSLEAKETFEVEVKTDGYTTNTGNLVFEKSCGKKPSGVFVTTSRYFVYFMPLFKENNVYIIRSEKLKKLLTDNFNDCIVYGGDEGSNTAMYKISKNDFNDKFIKAGGKIVTYNDYKIPEKFNKQQFNKNNKYTYFSDKIEKYNDDNLL